MNLCIWMTWWNLHTYHSVTKADRSGCFAGEDRRADSDNDGADDVIVITSDSDDSVILESPNKDGNISSSDPEIRFADIIKKSPLSSLEWVKQICVPLYYLAKVFLCTIVPKIWTHFLKDDNENDDNVIIMMIKMCPY